MKAVMLAMRYLTNAFGNIIDVAVIALLEGRLGSQVGSKMILSFIPCTISFGLFVLNITLILFFHNAILINLHPNLSLHRLTNSFCLLVS